MISLNYNNTMINLEQSYDRCCVLWIHSKVRVHGLSLKAGEFEGWEPDAGWQPMQEPRGVGVSEGLEGYGSRGAQSHGNEEKQMSKTTQIVLVFKASSQITSRYCLSVMTQRLRPKVESLALWKKSALTRTMTRGSRFLLQCISEISNVPVNQSNFHKQILWLWKMIFTQHSSPHMSSLWNHSIAEIGLRVMHCLWLIHWTPCFLIKYKLHTKGLQAGVLCHPTGTKAVNL